MRSSKFCISERFLRRQSSELASAPDMSLHWITFILANSSRSRVGRKEMDCLAAGGGRKTYTEKYVMSSIRSSLGGLSKGPTPEKSSEAHTSSTVSQLAGTPLMKLRNQYRSDLFDDFLPFMDKYVIDHQYGGFMCNTDREGTRLGERKEAWFEGRGIWVYSFLFGHFGHNPQHLEVARKSVQFLLKSKPSEKDALWPSIFSREGKSLTPPAKTILGELFIAEGFAEFSKATNDPAYWDQAKAIILNCVRIYDRPDYDPDVVAGYNDLMARFGSVLPTYLNPKIVAMYRGPKVIPFPGARAQAVSMLLIRTISQMLETRSDPDLEEVLRHCIDDVINRYFNPEFQLNNELLNHDYSRPTNELAQFVYAGHAIETLTELLMEAVRTRDETLFNTAAQRFRRHLEVGWDNVYGGLLRSLNNVDENDWSLDKVLWEQEEALNGLLVIVEHTRDSWAKEAFGKLYTYVHEKYPLRQYGFPLWITAADREVTFERHAARVENYHHPRFLMFNLLILDRMIHRAKSDEAAQNHSA